QQRTLQRFGGGDFQIDARAGHGPHVPAALFLAIVEAGPGGIVVGDLETFDARQVDHVDAVFGALQATGSDVVAGAVAHGIDGERVTAIGVALHGRGFPFATVVEAQVQLHV